MREDALKIINRDQLVSCMNNTKWQKLMDSLNAIHVDKRVKYIDTDSPSNWQPVAWMPVSGYVEFSCGPKPFRFIEWLEINRIARAQVGRLVSEQLTDHSTEIQDVLRKMAIDFEERDMSYVIYGYRRPPQKDGPASRHHLR